MVILITGRPKSGKSTLAIILKKQIGDRAVILDGDDIRTALLYEDFSDYGRTKWMEMMINLALALSRQGFLPILALVSPFRGVRKWMRDTCVSEGTEFQLIYVDGSEKHMWEGSRYEVPDIDEKAIKISFPEGFDYAKIFDLFGGRVGRSRVN